MGQPAQIDDQAIGVANGALNPVDQFTLMIALPKIYSQTKSLSARLGGRFDIGQAFAAIDFRFPLAQQVEIWAIEDK
ncbi:MAG: hypothetical protein Tsb0016_20400 [Sphingomonadales bacterium]